MRSDGDDLTPSLPRLNNAQEMGSGARGHQDGDSVDSEDSHEVAASAGDVSVGSHHHHHSRPASASASAAGDKGGEDDWEDIVYRGRGGPGGSGGPGGVGSGVHKEKKPGGSPKRTYHGHFVFQARTPLRPLPLDALHALPRPILTAAPSSPLLPPCHVVAGNGDGDGNDGDDGGWW